MVSWSIKNTAERYGLVAMVFHWGMAILILTMLGLGLYMTGLTLSLSKLKLYGWHKALGMVIFSLVLMRLMWRWLNITPLLPAAIPLWQRRAAHSSHFILYGFMLLMPMTGWLMSSAAGLSVSVFGWMILPDLISPNAEAQVVFRQIHHWLAYGLMAVIFVHVAAAVKHHLLDRDNVLKRMLP